MVPLPDPLLGVRPTQQETRRATLMATFTQEEADDIKWLAGYLGSSVSAFMRGLVIKGMERESWQKALKER